MSGSTELAGVTVGELYGRLGATLGEHEARIVLEEASGRSFPELFATFAEPIAELVARRATEMAGRRAAGEPLQHVVGHWPFRTLDVLVDGRALVPRPETEELVSLALRELDRALAGDESLGPLALDLGTGSGVIALSLATERARLRVLAIDASDRALALAAANRARLDPSIAARVELRLGDWYQAVPERLVGRVRCIVANPPYLSEAEWEATDPVVRDHDPREALVGGGDEGTDALAAVVAGAPAFLAPGGALVAEIGANQGDAARTLARRAGAGRVEIAPDLAGRDRVLIAAF